MVRIRHILLVAAALGLFSFDAIAADDFHYFYFKQRQDLTLDSRRIAIETTGAIQQESLQQVVEQNGAIFVRVRSVGISPWYCVDIEPADSNTITNIVTELPTLSFVAFASPLFLSERGGWLIPTKDILLQAASPARPGQAGLRGELVAWAHLENGFIYPSNYSTGMGVLDAANEMAADPEVRFAEPNMLFVGGNAFVPNDDGFPNCWGIHNTGQFGGTANIDMDGPEAWDASVGAPDVIVVVIDTGVQPDHPDIHQTVGVDLTGEQGGGGPVNEHDNHGTAVAGTISAIMNNSVGTVGIAPGCVTASARTFISTNEEGEWVSKTNWTVDALNWAQTIGARVTNNSNFYGFDSSAIAQKYEETRNAGLVHIASAGNEALPVLEYPASLPSVLSAAAITNVGSLAFFSNFGPDLDWVAPGRDVYTTDRTANDGYILGAYVLLSGTSFSSSYAAGVAALFISTHPGASAATVEEALKLTAVDYGTAGRDDTFGSGLINAADAVGWDPGCDQTPEPIAEPDSFPKNRYLSIVPTTGNRMAAISVTVSSLGPTWQSLEGETRWVSEPYVLTQGSTGTAVTLARLSCEPLFRDWSEVGLMHVIDPLVIPSATYSVRSVYQACTSSSETVASVPLVVRNARWGDITEPFNPPSPTTQPDFMDISAVVDRFRSLPTSPDVTRADLEPATPNQNVNFSDISFAVDAFRGMSYPFAPPCPCENPCP